MKALIDADILVYRIGFTTEEEDLEIAKYRMNELIERILADVNATSYQLYLTASGDETAFRQFVYPEYKQNRKAPKPKHYNSLREFLIEQWDAVVVSGIEADDALGIEQSSSDNTIICSIDKDLDMIKGLHYNFVKEVIYEVTPEQATFNFYKQLLMGDRSDNVKGIEGIGEKKAERLLLSYDTEEEFFDVVRRTYDNDEEMLATGEVLWILREPYPKGLWSCTTYGSRLVPEHNLPSELVLKTNTDGMECTGVETLKDGFQPDGPNPLDITDQMAKEQTLT